MVSSSFRFASKLLGFNPLITSYCKTGCKSHIVNCGCCAVQASEVGLGPGGLARHLINMALFAAGQEPLLPPPHPPAFDSSAQWAQFTGANDTLQEIAQQLADTSEKIVEALELGHHRVRLLLTQLC